MNHVTLMGRLARDPEISTNGENKIARYTLAVRRNFRSQQNVDWINCVCFGRLAENAEKYYKKGMQIAVGGRIQTGSYTNKDGKKIFTTDIIVGEQEFAESKKAFEDRVAEEHSEGQPQTSASPVQAQPQSHTPSPDDWLTVPEGFDENDIPFA